MSADRSAAEEVERKPGGAEQVRVDERDQEGPEHEDPARADEATVRFHAITGRLARALSSDEPALDQLSLEFDHTLTPVQRRAIEELWEARIALTDEGVELSALARLQMYNRALAALRPVLAMGRDPARPDLQRGYAQVSESLHRLRADIISDIAKEAVKWKKKKPVAKKAGDDDDDDDVDASQGEDTGGAPAEPTADEAPAEPPAPEDAAPADEPADEPGRT